MPNGCKIEENTKHICNVRTQDMLGSLEKGVRNDVITSNFAMQEFYELGV
jgi:hypothetical protein